MSNDSFYLGERDAEGTLTVYRPDIKDLDPRFDLRNHSPTGFECGYEGSGPAQLALAILADYFGNDDLRAVILYQEFKRAVIAKLPSASAADHSGEQWRLSRATIAAAIDEIEQRNPRLVERYNSMRAEPEELWREDGEP